LTPPRRAVTIAAPEPEFPMPLDATARGVFPIAVTPFLPDGAIDWTSVDRMVDFYLSCGADGLTILGIMGEAPKMTGEESIAIVRRVVARAGRTPVIVGVSAPGFAPMRALARASMEAGAAGVMIAPAPALRTDDQIVTYFADAIGAIGTDVPVVVQDYPLTLGVVMAPGVLRRIFTENPSAVMLKHEDWPGLDKIGALRRWQAEGALRPLSILCGNGGLFLDFEMVRGADGAMTGYAFPDMLVDLVRLHAAGDRTGAQDLFDAHLPLLRYEQQLGLGLAVRKHVLMRRGVIAHEGQRKPGAALNAAGRADVEFLLGRLARHDPRAALGPA
jgi:4-hydroxy-tetrahydrodipicolinate synthase